MSTAVRQIELADRVSDLHIPDRYSKLMLLVTFRGVPLGHMDMDVRDDGMKARFLMDRVAERFGMRVLTLWLEQSLTSGRGPAGLGADPTADVVICTSDRPSDLRRCLRSLSKTGGARGAVIVVDNGSECGLTRSTARRYGARYVREEKKGLDFARNAGLAAAEAEIVAFADDDVVVDRMWLDSIVRAFRDDEAVACVTGLTMPMELETEAQELFERYSDGGMRRGYERVVFDRFNLPPAAAGKVGAGANMAFRSSVLRRVGGFDEALDCGTPARAGGDTDMFYRLLRGGYKICYEPRALAWHRHRRTMGELRGQLAGYSTAVYAFLTKCLVEYGDLRALTVGCSWFKNHHLRNFSQHLHGRGEMPWTMVLGELLGVLRGPIAYLQAKSYVSDVRLRSGTERRGFLGRNGGTARSRFGRKASSILGRTMGVLRREHA